MKLSMTLNYSGDPRAAADDARDLERAGIDSHAWIINQSLAPLALSDPLLKTKQQEEVPHIQRLMDESGPKVYLSKWDIRLS